MSLTVTYDHKKRRIPRVYDELEDALRIARDCRKEMRGCALWWRRGSGGSTPETILACAKLMRNAARNMEAQAERIRQHRKESAV